jgi:hypothetical protein
VLGNLSRDPLLVRGFPRKHIEIRFEEVDERAFLFRIERRPDTERTAIIEGDHILDILGRLERAGRTLGRLSDLMVLKSRLAAEPLESDDCLSELKAFSVALESLSEFARRYVGPTVMIPFGPRIFSFRYV